jgi:hypothetical protein
MNVVGVKGILADAYCKPREWEQWGNGAGVKTRMVQNTASTFAILLGLCAK